MNPQSSENITIQPPEVSPHVSGTSICSDEAACKANGAVPSIQDKSGPVSEGILLGDEGNKPWRGFFSPLPKREALFTLEADLRPANLPSWQPHITITPRLGSDDDE